MSGGVLVAVGFEKNGGEIVDGGEGWWWVELKGQRGGVLWCEKRGGCWWRWWRMAWWRCGGLVVVYIHVYVCM